MTQIKLINADKLGTICENHKDHDDQRSIKEFIVHSQYNTPL